MVPRTGLEPVLRKERDFKSLVSTVPPPGRKESEPRLEDALFLKGLNSVCRETETEHESGFRISDVTPEEVWEEFSLRVAKGVGNVVSYGRFLTGKLANAGHGIRF